MSYYDYIQNNIDDCFYVVTNYGCNSTPSDLWTPITMLFTKFTDAHEYFLKISPDLKDKDNYAEQFIAKFDSSKINEKYVVIEVRVQTSGYHGEYGDVGYHNVSFAKRPEGVVLARCLL